MAELRTELAETLGGAYTLERQLGGGGMSRVFLAEEKSLGRRVVVKVLPSEMTSRVSVERFKGEIALAARLQHPHIVTLLSAGAMYEWLNRACREHDPHVMGINVLNSFARFRGDDRFKTIVRRLGLEGPGSG